MAFSLTPMIFFSFFCVALFCSVPVLSFSVDLIHRDSPGSPLYNPSLTHEERLDNALQREISRISYFHHNTLNSAVGIHSQIHPVGGDYAMKLSIGTPPVPIYGIIDSGSALTWTQCTPCPNCYTPAAYPFFDPVKSSTYAKVSCQDKSCNSTSLEYSNCSLNTCKYRINYGGAGNSFTIGDLARDTFTIESTSGKTISIPNMVFGCGHNNRGLDKAITGIIGLGGDLSIVEQLGASIGGKFSYCLPPITSATNVVGKLNFGDSAVVSGPGVVSTPLIFNDGLPFYSVHLEAISVGNTTLAYKSSVVGDNGDVYIDSGTAYNLLDIEFTKKLEVELKRVIGKTPIVAPRPYGLCYKAAENIKFPTITLRFKGASLDISGDRIFKNQKDGLVCLTVIGTYLGLIGNLVQVNYLVGYDLVNKMVSFKPTDCTNN